MSEPTGRGVKTLAIRIPNELHAQLVIVASLEDASLNDTILGAIQELIERKRADGDLATQAAKALEEMEREAQIRRQALQALLGPSGQTPSQQAPPEEAPPSRGRSRRDEPAS